MPALPRIGAQDAILRAARFPDERSRVPEAWEGRVLDLVGRAHLARVHKRGTPTFSPVVYRAGAARGKRGIAEATALVLDFDHLPAASAEEVYKRLAERGWAWVGYSSFSVLSPLCRGRMTDRPMFVSEAPARRYEPIAVGSESTVVAEFVAEPVGPSTYQSEADLEREFIERLQAQAYEYLPITSEAQLVANLRAQLEALNGIIFSNAEWERFFAERVASSNDTAEDKTRRIQEDHVQLLTRDNGATQYIKLIDKVHVHNNRLQVINQYEIAEGAGGAARSNRYDVTVLVNGLPLVHIELKRRGVDIREAFNQINRYQRDSFWAGSGLFDYVQVFVISNGTLTK